MGHLAMPVADWLEVLTDVFGLDVALIFFFFFSVNETAQGEDKSLL